MDTAIEKEKEDGDIVYVYVLSLMIDDGGLGSLVSIRGHTAEKERWKRG